MKITVIEPQTPEEFKQYYSLRYKILRKPWGQPRGSERDNEDEISHHRMIIDEATGDAIAVGRLQVNTKEEAQIWYITVSDAFQRWVLGSIIMESLEKNALENGAMSIILQSGNRHFSFIKIKTLK